MCTVLLRAFLESVQAVQAIFWCGTVMGRALFVYVSVYDVCTLGTCGWI